MAAGEHGATRLLTADPVRGRVLLLDPPEDTAVAAVRAAAGSDLVAIHARTFDMRRTAFATLWTGSASEDTAGSFDLALMYLPKGKARQHWLLDQAQRALGPAGELRVVGGKREGIRSIREAVNARFTEPLGVSSGGHAQCVAARRPRAPEATQTHGVDVYARAVTVDVPGGPLRCVWYPGVYGAEKLDEGTALLLQAIAPAIDAGALDDAKRVLDVGCGSGVLGAALARAAGARGLLQRGLRVELVDVDALAVEAARATLADLGLPDGSAVTYGSDVYGATAGRYDWILSNPPFHDGVGTSYDVADRLIREAPARLERGGRLTLVANAFLPYRDALDQAFGAHRVLAETGRFRVYEATRS